ncbi:MAG: hydrogenase iron-sulfur subunit [Candidatus Bathyarchaeota archaeon]
MSQSDFKPQILCFLCNWCSYAAADLAGVSRLQYPPIRVIKVMCSGRVDPTFIIKALKVADGVLVGGCHIGDCHYATGNHRTKKRVLTLQRLLKNIGINPERVRLEWISAAEGIKFAEVVNDFTNQIKELGPNPLRMMN